MHEYRPSYGSGDVARLFGVSANTVRARHRAGLLPGFLLPPGRTHYRVTHDELAAFCRQDPDLWPIYRQLLDAAALARREDKAS